MNKKQIFNETKAYEDNEGYSLREIYSTCAQTFSSYKTITKIKEYGLPPEKYDKCGIIPDLSLIWYAYNYRLSFFKYELNECEELPPFSSKVLFIDVFKPKQGIFNSKIIFCLMILTENQIILYGVDRDSKSLINTNFVISVPSTPVCYVLKNGSIYLGCENGNVYEVIYKSLDSWSFKLMYLYSPDTSIISNIVPSIFKRKKHKIIAMSANTKYLITLSKKVSVYNIEGGIFKVKDIFLYKEYIDIQIIEEKYGEVFFYCVMRDGTRDFYDTKHLFTKSCFLDDTEQNQDLKIKTAGDKFIILHKNKYKGTLIHFVSLNLYQQINMDRSKPCENQELISLQSEIYDCFFYEKDFFVLTKTKLIFYEILDLKRYVAVSRVEDVYNLLKNLGIRESLVLYFDLLSVKSDTTKLEYLIIKIDDNHIKGLFSFIYRQLKFVLEVPVKDIIENENLKGDLDLIVQKFKNLCNKLKQKELELGLSIMNIFIQSVFYINLLLEYGINTENITFFRLIFNEEAEFKKKSLDTLMEIFKTNNSLDSLINLLSNKAPDYLPLNEIYFHKGFDLLKKYPSKDKLWEALKNFKNVPFNLEIISKFNDLKFYTGSVILIRKHFNFDHEETVKYLRTCVLCNGSISKCLEDKREDFLYAFFDALIANLLVTEIKTECACCEMNTNLKITDIIKLESKFLNKYLLEKTETHSNPLVYELYWKYCAYRDDRINAVKSLLWLIDFKPITLEKRIDLLQKAKTVSLHTTYQDDIKKRCSLKDIQLKLIEKGEDNKPIKISLLSADILLNDYAYKYPDLALQIIDQSLFTHNSIIKSLLQKSMEGDFKSAVKFLTVNKFHGTVFNCEIIGDILLDKMTQGNSLSKTLCEIGFSYSEIQKYIEKKIKQDDDVEFKNFLIEDFRGVSDDKKYFKQLEQLVAKN